MRRSRSGCVITRPRLRRDVPDSQLKTSGTSVSGTSRSSRSSRIHDQLLATVVLRTRGGLVRVIDDVLDRFALGDLAQHWRLRAYPIACGSTAREDRSAEAVEPRTIEVIAASSATALATRKPSWYEASVATVAPPCSARWAGIRRAMTAAAVAVPRAMPRLRLVASSPAAVPMRARQAAPMTALLFGEVKRPVPIPFSSNGGGRGGGVGGGDRRRHHQKEDAPTRTTPPRVRGGGPRP